MMQAVSSCVGLLEHQGLMNDRVRSPVAGTGGELVPQVRGTWIQDLEGCPWAIASGWSAFVKSGKQDHPECSDQESEGHRSWILLAFLHLQVNCAR